MKKLLLSSLLAVILLSAITGSVAFFTDSIQTSNTIASGNLEIALHEYKRIKNDDGSYSNRLDYFDSQGDLMIYPSVGDFSIAARDTVTLSYQKEGETPVTFSNVNMYVSGIGNFEDKIVAAENIGSLPLYTRIYVAVPTLDGASPIHLDTNSSDEWDWTVLSSEEIDGRLHDVYVATLRAPLDPGAITPPSLLGFYLDSSVTNKHSEQLALDNDGTMNILVAARATQANVFGSDPDEAFLATYNNQPHPWKNDQ